MLGLFPAVRLETVGASDHDQVAPARIDGRAHLGEHLLCGNDLLALQEPAALGPDLVLDVEGGDTGVLEASRHLDDRGLAGLEPALHGHEAVLGVDPHDDPAGELPRGAAHDSLGGIGSPQRTKRANVPQRAGFFQRDP